MKDRWEMEVLMKLMETMKFSTLKWDKRETMLCEKFKEIPQLNLSEAEATDRTLYCINNLPFEIRSVMYAYYKDGLNTLNVSKTLGITSSQSTALRHKGERILTGLSAINILAHGIEEGSLKNSEIRNEIIRKYKNKEYDFTITEMTFLSVRHSTINTTTMHAMLGAGILDFSEIIFADYEMVLGYKKIGKWNAKVIVQYMLDEYNVSIPENRIS